MQLKRVEFVWISISKMVIRIGHDDMPLVSPAIDQHVGRKLESLRTSVGLSQAKLAEHAGLSVPQIQRFELGESSIAPSVLWELCGILGVRVGEFFTGLEVSD